MKPRNRFLLQPRSMSVVLIAILLSVGAFWPAHAVRNIRNVAWDEPTRVRTLPTETRVRLTFDAELSAVEMMYGTTSFSITTLQTERSPQLLAQYSIGPVAERPPPGTAVHVELELEIECNGTGTWVHAGTRGSRLSYLHPLKGQVELGISRSNSRNSRAEVWDGFGLGLRDENGNPSEAILRADNLACEIVESIDASIGVYFDRQGTQCSGTIDPGETRTVYVVAKYGPQTQGIAGAEFRFVGVPETWDVAPVPNPEILAVGNPFGDGTVTGFSCPSPQALKYVLYEVLVRAGDVREDVVFSIEARIPPINASLECPIFVSCDAPRFSQSCVSTVPCFVNSTKSTPCATAVSVAQTTWSAVKQMFR